MSGCTQTDAASLLVSRGSSVTAFLGRSQPDRRGWGCHRCRGESRCGVVRMPPTHSETPRIKATRTLDRDGDQAGRPIRQRTWVARSLGQKATAHLDHHSKHLDLSSTLTESMPQSHKKGRVVLLRILQGKTIERGIAGLGSTGGARRREAGEGNGPSGRTCRSPGEGPRGRRLS